MGCPLGVSCFGPALAVAVSLVLLGGCGPDRAAPTTGPADDAADAAVQTPSTPGPRGVCEQVGAAVRALGFAPEVSDGAVPSASGRAERITCRIYASGPTAALEGTEDPSAWLRRTLQAEGWREDPRYGADGPGTTAFGLRREEHLCLFRMGAPSFVEHGEIVVSERFELDVECGLGRPGERPAKAR